MGYDREWIGTIKIVYTIYCYENLNGFSMSDKESVDLELHRYRNLLLEG